MAKLDQLPSKDIIDGMKGVIDYYYWKGIPVSRKWPRKAVPTPSPDWTANTTAFAYINQIYRELPSLIVVALQQLAAGTTQTAKDYLVRAHLKGLFDLMPSEYYATEETAQKISDRIGAVDASDPGSVIDRLADILTALATLLKPTDLNIEAVSKDLQVDDVSDFLNQGDLIRFARQGNLSSSTSWTTVGSITGKGILKTLFIFSNYELTEWRLLLDDYDLPLPATSGDSYTFPSFDLLNTTGPELDLWKIGTYDVPNLYFTAFITREIQFNDGLTCRVRQNSGATKKCVVHGLGSQLT